MKKIFTIIVLILIVLPGAAFSQWRVAVEESNPSFNDMCMVNEKTGWCVGTLGVIYKTTDGGDSWNKLSPGITDTMNSVFFLNENIGFTGTKNGKVLKTTNGGLAWQSLTVPSGITGNVTAIYFANEQKGWVLNTNTTSSKITYTTDGGNSWTTVLTNAGNLYDMNLIEPGRGVVVGGGVGKIDLYYTTDGTTWTKAPAPSLGGFTYTRTDIRGVTMFSKDLVYATGYGTFAAGLQPSIMLKSTNGGATWTYLIQTEENRVYDNMNALKFKDTNTGWVFGGGSRGPVICKTTDGGTNWIQQVVPFGGGIKKVAGFGDKLWLLGDYGVLVKSTDFGNSWQLISKFHNASYYSIESVGDKYIYAAGAIGIFAKSSDGGATWSGSFAVSSKVVPNIQSLFFFDENTGLAGQNYNLLNKTTDGGKTWKPLIPDTMSAQMVNNDICFPNKNLGFVVGQGGSNVDKILKTTDGGLTWSGIYGVLGKTLKSVSFANETNGIAVAGLVKVLYTKDGGNNWLLSTFNGVTDSTFVEFKRVAFLNSTTALTVGGQKIFKTTDAGQTWNPAPLPNSIALYNDLYAEKDGKTAYVLGYKNYTAYSYTNYIYKTTDAGSTWALVSDTTFFPREGALTTMTKDKAGNIWVCASGKIYTNAPLVSVRETGSAVPGNYSLSQNYPNPFNPTTTISFNIGVAGKVSLKVYDILGREAATLVDKEMNPGSYSVDFNAGLSSGVYFYTLKAGNYSGTKKMVILK